MKKMPMPKIRKQGLLQTAEFRAGAVLAGIIVTMSITGLFYTPFDPYHIDSSRRFIPPGGSHILGTDNFGRDVFSRIISGGLYTLIIALCTVAASAAAGIALGLLAAYSRAFIDDLIMRTIDIVSSLPGLLITLIAVALMGNSPLSLCMALTILFIPGFTRVMRNSALQYKQADFILAERLLGAGLPRIIFVHMLPNIIQPLLSTAVLGLSGAILAEASMSYLGLGIQPPTPSWGRMLSESQNFLSNAPWCSLTPGLCIVLSVLAFHFMGEGIRKSNSWGIYSGQSRRDGKHGPA